MIEAGVHLGLPRATATDLVVQTVVGSAKMLRETGTHPVVLREQVTSPGGTTAAALRELEIHKVRPRSSRRWRPPATVRGRCRGHLAVSRRAPTPPAATSGTPARARRCARLAQQG
jgi:hypothetical protein